MTEVRSTRNTEHKVGARRGVGLATALFLLCSGAAAAQVVGEAAQNNSGTPAKQPYFLWAENSVSLLPYGWGYEVDPSEQSTFTFEHTRASKIGDFFMFVDFTRFHDANGGDESTWYGELSPRLSLGKTLDRDASFTLFRRSLFEVKDVLLAAQYERGEDPDVAEAALVGIGFDLDVREAGLLGPLGKFNYTQLNFYARSELVDGVEHGFEDMQASMVAAYPFEIGSTQFLVDGYFDWVLGLGSEEWSYHLNPQIKADSRRFVGQAEESLRRYRARSLVEQVPDRQQPIVRHEPAGREPDPEVHPLSRENRK